MRKIGRDVLYDPILNKSTAFSEQEKKRLHLEGLVPDVQETEDLQLKRVLMQLAHKTTDLDRYIYLVNLLDVYRGHKGRGKSSKPSPIRSGSALPPTVRYLRNRNPDCSKDCKGDL